MEVVDWNVFIALHFIPGYAYWSRCFSSSGCHALRNELQGPKDRPVPALAEAQRKPVLLRILNCAENNHDHGYPEGVS